MDVLIWELFLNANVCTLETLPIIKEHIKIKIHTKNNEFKTFLAAGKTYLPEVTEQEEALLAW